MPYHFNGKEYSDAQWSEYIKDIFGQFEPTFGFNASSSWSSNRHPSDQQLLEHIRKETIEYFNKAFNRDMSSRSNRVGLPEESKVRVFGFMKKRLEYWNKEGFLVS